MRRRRLMVMHVPPIAHQFHAPDHLADGEESEDFGGDDAGYG